MIFSKKEPQISDYDEEVIFALWQKGLWPLKNGMTAREAIEAYGKDE